MKFNGYTNYATWNIMLWIGNDYDMTIHWEEKADDALDALDEKTNIQVAVWNLADELQDELTDEALDALESGWMYDILSNAMYEVNWEEIAKHLMTNAVDRYINKRLLS